MPGGFNWSWIISPAAGAVIGYVTNDVAVRMLLRPYEEKRIFGRRVPFTPGLIAKERGRIAHAIREVLDSELLSAEVLENALLSPRMMEQLGAAADTTIARLRAEENCPRVLLSGPLGAEHVATLENRACVTAREFILQKLLDSGLENQLAELVMAEVSQRLGSSMGMLKALLLDDKRAAQYQAKLAQAIREAMETRGPDLLDQLIGETIRDTMSKPLNQLAEPLPLDAVRGALLKEYEKIVKTQLAGILQMINLGGVVEDKLNAITMAELEEMIMAVMKKELRAIVWLGALLGCVMGFVQAGISCLL